MVVVGTLADSAGYADGALVDGGGLARLTDFALQANAGAGLRLIEAGAALTRGLIAGNAVGVAREGATDLTLDAVLVRENTNGDTTCAAAFCDHATPPPAPPALPSH